MWFVLTPCVRAYVVQVQLTVEGINFLDNTGYSILATADDGTILAAGAGVWDRDEEEDTTTVGKLM